MFFKNARVYKLSAPVVTAETFARFEKALSEFAHNDIGPQSFCSIGFCYPLHESLRKFAHLSGSVIVFAVKRTEKVLTAAMLKEAMDPELAKQQAELGRPLNRKEKQQIKEDLQLSMLPRAFSKSTVTQGYIDINTGRIVLNTASASRAEDILAMLRKALGSLPALPWLDGHKLSAYLQLWLQNKLLPNGSELGTCVQLKAPDEEGATANFKDCVLTADEVQSHLQDKLVKRIQLAKPDSLDFTVRDDLAITGFKWNGILTSQNDELGWEDLQARMDADILLATSTLNGLLDAIDKAASDAE